jgi:xanthine dehydrogenase YagS FAD-binding subunit
MMNAFSYVRPQSVKEAIEQLSSEKTYLHAGGTDLMTCMRDSIFEVDKVVSLNGIPQLKGPKSAGDGGLRIGALTTIREVAGDPLIGKHYPALARAASEVASPQLRNQGTLGGNLCQKTRCWYYRGDFHCLRKGGNECFAVEGENAYHCIFGGANCFMVYPSDTAPALGALDAKLIIQGPKGERVVPVEKFYVLPEEDYTRETILESGELVTEIVLPAPVPGMKSTYRKVRARRSWDFALAGLALAVTLKEGTVTGSRVFLSGAAPIPWRSEPVEEVLNGNKLDEDTIRKASEAVVRNAEPMEQNGYKIPLFKAVVTEELRALASA